MKKLKYPITQFIFIALCVMLCGCVSEQEKLNEEENEMELQQITIQKIEHLSEDFVMGMDASCVPALEASGVKYYDFDGQEKDVFELLSENGVNAIRVRIWNDPFDEEGRGYGGGNCDLANAIEIGKRATECGMSLLVNFHYSDFWADPQKQMVPKAWQKMNVDEKSQALYAYTRESLKALMDAGVDVSMVQVGNETNSYLCGETEWENITKLMKAGALAVREVCPEALVAVHFSNPENAGTYEMYGAMLHKYEVDYDVFVSSYYPFWHGTLDNLATLLNHIHTTYGKKVMIGETSYAYTAEDTDFYPNTVSLDNGLIQPYPYTVQGQIDHFHDLTDTVVNKVEGCLGVFYWEGTWISVGGKSYEENLALWQRDGSGWATSYASKYDPKDAGQWYGGCTVENQALFDEHGHALESLKMFKLLKTGLSKE